MTDRFGPEHRAKLSEAAKNRCTPEYRAKKSAVMRANWEDPEFRSSWEAAREKRTEAMRQASRRPELRKKRSEAAKKQWADPDASIRKGIQRAWSDPEKRERMVGPIGSPTSIETIVITVLEALGVEYISQYPIGPYMVDLYIPSRNLVIECDGDYWHSLPEVVRRDRRRDAYLKREGYSLVRLREQLILTGDTALTELLCSYVNNN